MLVARWSRKLGRFGSWSVLAAALLVSACATTTPPAGPGVVGTALDFRSLAGWTEDNHAEALPALLQSCRWFTNRNASDPRTGAAADWIPACEAARRLTGDPAAARRYFETWFKPVPVGAGTGEEGLFTGYYEVELRGSWTRTDRFQVPVYRMPPLSIRRPLPTRARIARGALAGLGLELLWVDDPIDAFFLEIQGSGRVVMPDGSVVAVHYHGQNGQTYYPVGRYLIDQGFATREEMSLQLIKSWLKAHPAQARAVMDLNPSYVFFKTISTIGARGAMNLELTAGRSLAIDPNFVPLGMPLWVDLKNAPVPGGAIRRLVVAQDTGGAIKGAVRGDLFWGHGPAAEAGAGVMKARGSYVMLVPRTVAERRQAAVTTQ